MFGVVAAANVNETVPSNVKSPDETSTAASSSVPLLVDVIHLSSLFKKISIL